MESTSGFTGSEPDKSEKEKGEKKDKRSYSVSRPDLALRFSYQQREVPKPQREAMGHALLDGVVFMRPAGERPKTEENTDKKEKKGARPSFEDIMREGGFGTEFVAATTKEGEQPKVEPAAEHRTETTSAPESTTEKVVPTHDQPETFEDIMKRAEVPDHLAEFASDDNADAEPLTAQAFQAPLESPVPAMHAPERMSDDDAFRDIVRREGAADPGPARHIDAVPGMPFMVGGAGEGGGPPNRYENAGFDSPEGPEEPQAFRDARAPAGNVLRPGGLAGIGALEAQRRLDSLRHRAAEAGLAGGITFLGLLLAAEHITAKRRDKKQQKQINTLRKDVKSQGQQLQQEQFAHQQTRANLNRVTAEHNTTAEKLREVTASPAAQEFAPAAAGAFAGAELAQRHSQAETPLQAAAPGARPRPERFTPVPGAKPEQMAEADALAAERAGEAANDEQAQLREGERRVRESWYDAIVDREGRVVEGAIAYGQGMQQERRSEQLRDRTADTPQQSKQSSGTANGSAGQAQSVAVDAGSVATHGMYRLPTYNSPALLSGMTNASLPVGPSVYEDPQHLLAAPKKDGFTATLKKPWVWIFAGLLLIAFFVSSLIG